VQIYCYNFDYQSGEDLHLSVVSSILFSQL
jgi:hypothetical protein